MREWRRCYASCELFTCAGLQPLTCLRIVSMVHPQCQDKIHEWQRKHPHPCIASFFVTCYASGRGEPSKDVVRWQVAGTTSYRRGYRQIERCVLWPAACQIDVNALFAPETALRVTCSCFVFLEQLVNGGILRCIRACEMGVTYRVTQIGRNWNALKHPTS
ncbi:hypothetical protein LIA77_05431 [Sarocladium implicatum]|jgi:hypothetical protein|nr:hypothetical protein LIA77_05431 [Sarocladium implicatum]